MKFLQKILFENIIYVEKIRDRFASGVFFRNKNNIRVNFQNNFSSSVISLPLYPNLKKKAPDFLIGRL